MTAAVGRVVASAPRGVLVTATYTVSLLVCAVMSLTSLAVGAAAWIAAQNPSFAAALAGAADGNPWAQGVLAAAQVGWPTAQDVLDYALSVLAIAVAGALVAGNEKSWSTRLLVLAMVGSAGAFNLHAHAAAMAVETAIGLQLGPFHQVLYQGIPGAAYTFALLVFPSEREHRPVRTARAVLVLAGVGTLLLVGLGNALPHAVSGVLLLGFVGPVVGVLVLPRQIRGAPTVTARTQARLLFSVVAVVSAIATVLAVITVLMWTTGWGNLLLLVDPTVGVGGSAGGEPTALLFWFSRLASVAIAGAVFVATRRGGLWNAERLFSRGLAAGLTAALLGGGYVLVRNSVALLVEDGALPAAVLTIVLAAVTLRPVYVRAERWTDRLLFGTRPTPYSALAGVTALSRATATDAPDLARVAEAVGRGLGAAICRLTVTRPGLRDRSYTWTEGRAPDPDGLVEVVIRHGTEAIGTLAVDYDAVAGLQRQHLLEDIADSLGLVLQASRYGIELERQLRAALAHASEIAASRRAVVAEMDGERRRIERDLHDGAQHHLVSLRLTLGLVEHQVSTEQFDKARERLEQVAGQIDMAESILAETAMGVSSPLLAEMGLFRALEKELASGQPPVAVDASDVDAPDPGADGRFPHDVESAVYFCCLEAVNNARKHAQGATIGVRLCTEDGRLRFTVQDDGPGWDQSRVTGSPGRGLRNVTTRISAVGGRIEVRSAPGQGTTVDGSVPIPRPAAPSPDASRDAVPVPAGGPAAPAPDAAAEVAQPPLLDQVRDAVREARERYRGTERTDAVRVLAERLDAPLRIGVSGDGDGSAALVPALAALDPDGAPSIGRAALIDTALIDTALIDTAQPVSGASEGRPVPHADAFVVLLRRDADGDVLLPDHPDVPAQHRPAHAVGALLVEGPADEPARRAALDCAARRDLRRLCHVVAPVAPAFARAGVRLSDEQYRTLQVRAERDVEPSGGSRADEGGVDGTGADLPDEAATLTMAVAGAVVAAGETRAAGGRAVPAGRSAGAQHSVRAAAPERERPVPFGHAVVQFAVGQIRSGRAPTRQALATALVQASGLPRLRELVAERLTRRADALKARAVLLALEDLVRRDPPAVGGDGLRYRLDRIRSGAFELTELDVVDALRAGDLDLPDGECHVAERLLGAAGTDPRTRLGLSQSATQQEILQAAAEQLARWHRRAANPLAGVDVRKTADVLVQACERLLVGTAA